MLLLLLPRGILVHDLKRGLPDSWLLGERGERARNLLKVAALH